QSFPGVVIAGGAASSGSVTLNPSQTTSFSFLAHYNGTKFPAANATCEPFTLNVVPQFGANFTPGFWKNHPKATNPFLPITLGNYNVTTFANAVIILSGMGCGNFGALNCMAGMLLAAKLNLANGGGTCIIPTIAAADALLIANGYTGVT